VDRELLLVDSARVLDNQQFMDATKLARLEAWLEYADDLHLGPFFRDRANAGTVAVSASGVAVAEIGAPEIIETVSAARAAESVAPPAMGAARKPSAPFMPIAPSASLFEEKIENDSLEKIRQDIGPDCTRCKLHKARTKIVFGVGNPKAELVFVGEGPGRDEDMQGEPFVGRAGKLLTQMIEAMGLKRPDVYIANVVKCRPPENRLPEPDEIATCSPYLIRQIDAIRPKVIVSLGACSAQTLLQTTQGISKFRGEWFDFRGAKLMPTYHPAYLLRNPPAKADVWKDLQKVMAHLGLEVKKR
jgi:uracil-DNA glycosylase family 4